MLCDFYFFRNVYAAGDLAIGADESARIGDGGIVLILIYIWVWC
jgi:hypothetical protein